MLGFFTLSSLLLNTIKINYLTITMAANIKNSCITYFALKVNYFN